jgi:hypothetical protein
MYYNQNYKKMLKLIKLLVVWSFDRIKFIAR